MRMRKNFFKNQQGSFLLETLLAVLILSVGLVGLIRGLLSSLTAAKEAQAYSDAILAADNALLDVARLNGQKTVSFLPLETPNKALAAEIEMAPSRDLPVALEILQEAQVKVKWPGPLKQKEVRAVTLVFGPTDEKK